MRGKRRGRVRCKERRRGVEGHVPDGWIGGGWEEGRGRLRGRQALMEQEGKVWVVVRAAVVTHGPNFTNTFKRKHTSRQRRNDVLYLAGP